MKRDPNHWWWKFLNWCSKADPYPWVPWRGRTENHNYPSV